MRKIALPVVLVILASAVCGCPNGGKGKPQTSAPATWTDQAQEYEAGVELSLFQGTPMLHNPPDAVSFSRDGSILWAHGLDHDKNEFYVSQCEVTDKGLNPQFYAHGPDLVVSHAQSSPDGEECLVMSQVQPQGGSVRDVIYRVGEAMPEKLDHRSIVPWEHIQGLPKMLPDSVTFTKPFYSWDGGSIIIPFNTRGLAVVDKRTGAGRYVDYPTPNLPHPYTDKAFGELQDEDGARRIWGSFWYRGDNGGNDTSEVFMLDLETLKWELALHVPWPAFRCVAPKPSVDPWLVYGASSNFLSGDKQAPEYQRSSFYVPRLARIIPGAGTEDIISVFGEPVWEIALDPLGGRVFYADMQRKALVRFNPADGRLDYDPRWYTGPDTDQRTHLFCLSGGDRCYIWQGEILIRAEFTEHEKQKGYE